MYNLWSDMFIGIVAGVVATALWSLIYLILIKPSYNFSMLSGFEGTYNEYIKNMYAKDDEPPTKFDTINIKRDGNVLSIESTRDEPDELGRWVGEIQMNVYFPNCGKGYYNFVRDYKGDERWGFLEMCRKNKNTILVHRRYTYKDGEQLTFAAIWKKV